jgi:hypothetical protein
MDDKRIEKAKEHLKDEFARRHQKHQANRDAEEREFAIEAAAIGTKASGFVDDEIMTLDQRLAEVESDPPASARAGSPADTELAALLAKAKECRKAVASAAPDQRKAAVDRYYDAVQDAIEGRRRSV